MLTHQQRDGHIFCLIRIVGGEVQMGPTGTSAIDWPIVPAPGDYKNGEFGGMMIGRGNLPQCHFVHYKQHMT
jgi:hypothetical protein